VHYQQNIQSEQEISESDSILQDRPGQIGPVDCGMESCVPQACQYAAVIESEAPYVASENY
jgi:hypothetical protein